MLYVQGTGTEVQDVMQPDLVTIRANQSIGEMLEKMQKEKVSALPVVDDTGGCVGIISMTDMVKSVISTEKVLQSEYPHFDDCLWAIDMVQNRFGNDKVCEVMSEVLATISPDTSMHNAACIMLNNRVHHLPVISSTGALIGVLSSVDFVRLAAGSKPSE